MEIFIGLQIHGFSNESHPSPCPLTYLQALVYHLGLKYIFWNMGAGGESHA